MRTAKNWVDSLCITAPNVFVGVDNLDQKDLRIALEKWVKNIQQDAQSNPITESYDFDWPDLTKY
jgi:hypothetical protein